MGSPENKMLPPSYQTTLRAHLNESQYLTLQLLSLLLQAHRQVKLSSTDSISKPQTELTTLFSLASTVCQTLVVSPD